MARERETAIKKIIRRQQLREMVPLADSTIYEMEQRGEFPRRFALSPRCVVWDLAEVEAWLNVVRLRALHPLLRDGPDSVLEIDLVPRGVLQLALSHHCLQVEAHAQPDGRQRRHLFNQLQHDTRLFWTRWRLFADSYGFAMTICLLGGVVWEDGHSIFVSEPYAGLRLSTGC